MKHTNLFRRGAALLLSLALLLTVLAGCGDASGSSASQESSTLASTSSQVEESASQTETSSSSVESSQAVSESSLSSAEDAETKDITLKVVHGDGTEKEFPITTTAATLGDAGESAKAADASAKAAATSAKGAADSASAAAGSAASASSSESAASASASDAAGSAETAERAEAESKKNMNSAYTARGDAIAARDAAQEAESAAASSASSAASDADRAEAAAELSDGAAVKAVTEKVDELTRDAPEKFDTLKEIADALEAQEDMGAVLTSQIAGKADREHTHTSADITDAVSTTGRPASASKVVKTYTDGYVHVNGAPTEKTHATPKSYVDGRVQLVTALPSSPDPTVLYLIAED